MLIITMMIVMNIKLKTLVLGTAHVLVEKSSAKYRGWSLKRGWILVLRRAAQLFKTVFMVAMITLMYALQGDVYGMRIVFFNGLLGGVIRLGGLNLVTRFFYERVFGPALTLSWLFHDFST